MIQVENLIKHYKLGGEIVKAVDDISFRIEDSEMLSIIGPSGSGKSTTMQILGGLDSPDSGTVVVDGQNIAKLSRGKLAQYRNKKIGFIFQTFNLQPHLTAIENVELPLLFSTVSRRKRREMAKDALIKVGLQDRLNHRPNELSGGQRQRVSIARALVNQPSIIFADEPTGNLDSKTGQSILELLRMLNKEEGVTIIIVTHDEYIAKSTDRIIQIKDGKIINDKVSEKALTIE
ncbi:MAG: ABC transporter ATP-binding protein [Candidatus Dojkabacteria bacterium]